MCKHKTCTIAEEFQCFDEIIVVDGQIQKHKVIDPYPTGSFFVRCRDCGMERTYGARRPKWLDAYLEAGPPSVYLSAEADSSIDAEQAQARTEGKS